MKILFATGIYPPDIGGPASYTEIMAAALRGMGHSVAVVTYGEGSDDKKNEIFRVSRKIPAGARHLLYALKVALVSKYADVIYAQDSVSSGLPVFLACLILRKPYLVKVVGDYAWEQGQGKYGIRDSLEDFQTKKYGFKIELLRFVRKFVTSRAAKVITPSHYLQIIVEGWGVEKEKICVIYNAIPGNDLTGPELSKRPKTILSVGRLVPWKGYEELIFAMKDVREQISDAQLVIVGDGPERAKLEGLILELGLEVAVHMPGRVPHNELGEWYGTARAFALNTSYEGFSHQLIEVMSAGLPVAATSAGGNAELLKDGENSLVFPVNDIEAIKLALVRLLTDMELANQLAKNASFTAKQFTEERMVQETVFVFSDFLNGERVGIVSLDNSILESGAGGESDSPSFRRMIAYAGETSGLAIAVLAPGEAKSKTGTKLVIKKFGGKNKISAVWHTWRDGARFFKTFRPKVISGQDPFFAGLLGLVFAKSSGAKFIAELHGDFWPEDKKLWPGFARNSIARIILRRADAIRVVSNKVKIGLLNFDKKLTGKQIEVFPIVSGEINPWPFSNKVRLGNITDKYPKDAIFALFVGRLTKEKGLDWFLPVFANVAKQVHLYLRIVGDGEEREALNKLAKELETDSQISFVGTVPEARLDEEYRTADFLVLPSRQESWGRVVVEAMQNGCPVIATKEVGAAHDLLKDGENALIVPFGDTVAMGQALIKMASFQDLRKKLSEAGKASSQGLSFKSMVDKMTGLWKSV